jgi:DNA (cytosine-5)-methyltransferase 1
MLYGLDLFSGIGGITLALQSWIRPIAYCEIEPYCQSVLLQRMQEGNLPKAPIWDDIRTLRSETFASVDLIYCGFPCQDISVAGLQKGLEGKRSGLIFEVFRLLDETKAPFLFLENVPNIRTKGAERICKELAERGYDCRWCNISAADVGALHKMVEENVFCSRL